ncbi:MAG: hypothetical protein H6713_36905 [Myxococcales bacterium]|nr:hypothetical protein [Myxococcales bacterium]
MSYSFYLILHLLGIALVLFSLGGLALHAINGGTRETNKARGLVAATHGVGLLLIFVAGFGMLPKIGVSLGKAAWVHPKILIWLVLAAGMTILYRKPSSARAMWVVIPLLVLAAAYLAIDKPFGAAGTAP